MVVGRTCRGADTQGANSAEESTHGALCGSRSRPGLIGWSVWVFRIDRAAEGNCRISHKGSRSGAWRMVAEKHGHSLPEYYGIPRPGSAAQLRPLETHRIMHCAFTGGGGSSLAKACRGLSGWENSTVFSPLVICQDCSSPRGRLLRLCRCPSRYSSVL